MSWRKPRYGKNTEAQVVRPPIFIKPDQPGLKPLIVVDHLYKSFGKKAVLKDVNFTINEGEHLILLGSNGTGKTVLVETIAGLIKPTKGQVKYHFDSHDINKQIGVQFQAIDFPAHLTPSDIIKFNIDLFKIKISPQELDELIIAFKIDHFLTQRCSKLSGGQKQRLNVLLSLINKPKVVFLDEFSTGLDFLIKSQIEEFLITYARQNQITVVIVSHDVNEIEIFAKKIVALHKGEVVLSASADEVVEHFGSIRNLMKEYIK